MVRAPPAVQHRGVLIPAAGGEIKYRCTIPKPNGQPCNAIIKNTKRCISSHRKIHDPNSAYNREAVKFQQPIPCREIKADGTVCNTPLTSKQNMLRHYGSQHGHRGQKATLFGKYGV
ncbi:hypothetical protein DL765_004506 [Monosporascus sp. GIB2]|nr:hypothetical protein DL765_004506 [Monosporascus sp. GIB2]